MALAIIVGNARRDRFVGVRAGAERDGKTDKRARDTEGAIAIEGYLGCHRVILVPPQSVIKP